MRLLFATTNSGKFRETKKILSSLGGTEVLSLDDFPKLKKIEIEETGESFNENALLKATAYGNLSQTPTLSEDAGLEVFALDGRPGVHSARYGKDGHVRNQKLLKELEGIEDRSARFTSVFCFFDPKNPKEPRFFKGVSKGTIAFEERGKDGFDYDYVFIPDGQTKTWAELGKKFKNQHSHRRVALEEAMRTLF